MDQTTSDGAGTASAASDRDDTRATLAGAAHSAKGRMHEIADEQKNAGAEHIHRAAGAIREAATQLEQQIPFAAGYVRDAAERLDGAATALRERSLDDLIGGVTRFARSQPAVFFGGAVLVGFAVSRFLKSSGDTTPGTPRI